MIKAEHIYVSFKKENQKKLWGIERQQVLSDISFEIKKGDCLGILGESGSGKSTLGRVLCGLLKPDKGRILFHGEPMKKQKRAENKEVISVVFQDYTTSANPRFTVRGLIGEGLRARERREGISLNKEKEMDELLTLVGLSTSCKERLPHELSGGQLQRVCIARALAINPSVILFDEAISSLDAHTQVQIMDLLKQIQKDKELTYIFITHDLTSVTYLCTHVLFLYQGEVAEVRSVETIGEAAHPYAKRLLHAIFDVESMGEEEELHQEVLLCAT